MTVLLEKRANEKLIHALTIQERAQVITTKSDTEWEKWQNRKSLLKKTDVDFLLENYIDEQSFKKGIQPISQQSMDGLLTIVEQSEWYKLFEEIFTTYEESGHYSSFDYTYAFRFFLQHMKQFLKDETTASTPYKFHVDAIISIVQGYAEEIMGIMSRTFAADIQRIKTEQGLPGKNGEQRFESYLQQRFSTAERAREFYEDYPALLRLLATKTIFFKRNIATFIRHLNESSSKICNVLKKDETVIQRIGLSAGDSHHQGKSVLLVYFSEKSLIVYKPKNLSYTKELDSFFNQLNDKLDTDFYSVKRIVEDNYSFEEFIERQACDTEEQVEQFYYRYGELIGLAYILKGTDFHYENIIAHGEKPVLIDVETFLQQNVPLEFGENAHVNAKEYQLNSVTLTGLVPFEILADRSESKKEGINISGLSYGKQKTPFQILKLNNEATDEMKFEYMDHYIESKQNIPLLSGQEIPFEAYKNTILKGFKDFLAKVIQHREEIIARFEQTFTNARVRNVVRPTQRYVDLLQFSYHPDCMQSMIEREKVLHNLFAYPYSDKTIAKFEIEEMLEGDIPQFFNVATDMSLYTSDGVYVCSPYKKSIKEIISDNLRSLSQHQIDEQSLQMELSMGTFKHTAQIPEQSPLMPSVDVHTVIEDAISKLLTEAIEDNKTNSMTWIDLVCKDTWKYEAMNNQLYDGLPGMYLLFTALQATYPHKAKSYEAMKEKILNTMLVIPSSQAASVFYGNGALIYPLTVDALLNDNKNALLKAQQLADQVMAFPIQNNNDWLTGLPSVIVLYSQLYKVTHNKAYAEYAKSLANQLKYDESSPYLGFIHGNSSAYYALSLVNPQSPAINHWQQLEDQYWDGTYWKEPRSNKGHYTHAICHGSTGILLNRLAVDMSTDKKELQERVEKISTLFDEKSEDSVCHGTAGDIELILALEKANIEYPNKKEILSNKVAQLLANFEEHKAFRLQGYESIQSKGFFSGTAGVIYTLLRVVNNAIPSAVLLDLPIESWE